MTIRKHVLSIDGGGTGGVFMFHMLYKLINEYKQYKPDLIVGVSAGAIIGAMLATGRMNSMSSEKMMEYITRTFNSEEHRKGPWFRPKYKGDIKTDILYEVFGDMLLGDVPINIAIITDIVDGSPLILTSWDHPEIPLYKALDGSSAIPVLFPPVTINDQQHVDGGAVTSSPVCIAALLGSSIFNLPIDNIRLCSIGLSRHNTNKNKFKNDEMGIVQWMSLGIPLKLLSQRSYLENTIISQILRDNYLRIESTHNGRVDNLEMMDFYIRDVDKVYDANKDEIDKFFNVDYV